MSECLTSCWWADGKTWSWPSTGRWLRFSETALILAAAPQRQVFYFLNEGFVLHNTLLTSMKRHWLAVSQVKLSAGLGGEHVTLARCGGKNTFFFLECAQTPEQRCMFKDSVASSDAAEPKHKSLHGQAGQKHDEPSQKHLKRRGTPTPIAENENKRQKKSVPRKHHQPEEPVQGDPYGCNACADGFDTLLQLKDHLKEVHPEPAPEVLERPYRCSSCHRTYKVRLSLLSWMLEKS